MNTSNSIPTEEALADKAEQQKLEIILLLEDNIREISSVLSNYSYYNTKLISKEELDLDQEEDMTSVMPELVIKEEYQNSVEGVVVIADVKLFKDQLRNLLAKVNHLGNIRGCSHLLGDKVTIVNPFETHKQHYLP